MPLIAWDKKFVSGNLEVDLQHQELFAMINTLHDAITARTGKDVLAPTLDKLAAYVSKHFAMEEVLMKAKRYPNYADHKAKHDELTRQAVEIIRGYKSGDLVLTITLSRFLGDWLRTHILGDDLAMIGWIKAHP